MWIFWRTRIVQIKDSIPRPYLKIIYIQLGFVLRRSFLYKRCVSIVYFWRFFDSPQFLIYFFPFQLWICWLIPPWQPWDELRPERGQAHALFFYASSAKKTSIKLNLVKSMNIMNVSCFLIDTPNFFYIQYLYFDQFILVLYQESYHLISFCLSLLQHTPAGWKLLCYLKPFFKKFPSLSPTQFFPGLLKIWTYFLLQI